MPAPPNLSICIPTYNRRDKVLELVNQLLQVEGAFEICVHVDGSTDGTYDHLVAIGNPRLQVSVGANRGRASAVATTCRIATGQFIMIFDDDDQLYEPGLHTVLTDCQFELPSRVVGFIYHLEDERGVRIGDEFPCQRTNFLQLRADYHIHGDKKEVVQAGELRKVMLEPHGRYRRVPTSLIWSHLALSHDVLCRNVVIGRKAYLEGGMTSNIRTLKSRNAYPMYLLYRTHIWGFARRRYRSLRFLLKALAGIVAYGAVSLIQSGN